MITTPSMGLKRWDQPNDIFSYVELSDNFALLDNHDHTSGKGVQIPAGGIANLAIGSTKIADNAITASKIAANAVTTSKILDANVTSAKLEPGLLPTYKVKTADEIRSSTTTLEVDSHLVFPGLAAGWWAVQGLLRFDGPANADLKVSFPVTPTSPGGRVQLVSQTSGTVSVVDINMGSSAVIECSSATQLLSVTGHFRISSAGSMQMEFAQGTPQIAVTTMQAQTWLSVARMA